jgi:hypothetical protein
MPQSIKLTPEARLINLRIIRESEPGVLLMCDRIMISLTAQQTATALACPKGVNRMDSITGIDESFSMLMVPQLGLEYVAQIMRKV